MENFTVISHIYNEEYLLPFWLEHHSKIFKHGIIIDYCSTDSSIDIITKLCPTWKIIKTKNILNGKPNFDAELVDKEVKEIETNVTGYKICLNTTEFLFIDDKKIMFNEVKTIYKIDCHSVHCSSSLFSPNTLNDLFKNIGSIKIGVRKHRFLHNHVTLNYSIGRHYIVDNPKSILSEDIFILHVANYNINSFLIKRKMQIQNNIPDTDKKKNFGFQHIIGSTDKAIEHVKSCCKDSKPICNYVNICDIIQKNINKKNDININYSELIKNSYWGKDEIILNNDINLLQKTDFNDKGYKIFKIIDYTTYLNEFVTKKIYDLTGKTINIEKYHEFIDEDEHKKILNNMPYKKNDDEQYYNFCSYLEKFVSDNLSEKVKIFNDDVWIRICRPSNTFEHDYNPYHKDIYLDFYRNIVNIYIPIVGSNELSSLTLHEGSHIWNENMIMTTNNGTNFENNGKKYSVSAISVSKIQLTMNKPNPQKDELLLFSPYLIHGGALNENKDITRFSLEIRFIKDDNNSHKQEIEYSNFLSKRYWR